MSTLLTSNVSLEPPEENKGLRYITNIIDLRQHRTLFILLVISWITLSVLQLNGTYLVYVRFLVAVYAFGLIVEIAFSNHSYEQQLDIYEFTQEASYNRIIKSSILLVMVTVALHQALITFWPSNLWIVYVVILACSGSLVVDWYQRREQLRNQIMHVILKRYEKLPAGVPKDTQRLYYVNNSGVPVESPRVIRARQTAWSLFFILPMLVNLALTFLRT